MSTPALTKEANGVRYRYFSDAPIHLAPRVGLRTSGKPSVFPFLPPRETKCSPDPTPVRIHTESKMQNVPFGPSAYFDAPRVGFEPTTNSLHIIPMFPKGVDYIIIPT